MNTETVVIVKKPNSRETKVVLGEVLSKEDVVGEKIFNFDQFTLYKLKNQDKSIAKEPNLLVLKDLVIEGAVVAVKTDHNHNVLPLSQSDMTDVKKFFKRTSISN